MTESTEKNEKFLGAYFDRDSVLRLSRWAESIAWVILTIYLLSFSASFILFFAQYFNGLLYAKGMTFFDTFNMFMPYLQQPLPGVFYFFGLQALSKVLLILLDMEDNTRRAARNKESK
jgi:hypothetical protein